MWEVPSRDYAPRRYSELDSVGEYGDVLSSAYQMNHTKGPYIEGTLTGSDVSLHLDDGAQQSRLNGNAPKNTEEYQASTDS